MKVSELNAEQLKQLKQSYLTDCLMETENRTPSYAELDDATKTIPDCVIFEEYAGTLFSKDDFF